MRASLTIMCALFLVSACATSGPDHFYILSVQPQGASEARVMPTTQVTLNVTLPSLVDRSQMILNTSADGVIVLEHERWAAPLADLTAQILARDIERRRSDMLVASAEVNPSAAAVKISVDIVQMTVRKGGRASIDTQWRIVEPRTGKERVGGEVFSAPLEEDGYASVARALSDCLSLLADRLVAQLPQRD